MYPEIRMRRLRNKPLVRDMITEYSLSPSNFILPIFVKEGLGEDSTPIESMQGISLVISNFLSKGANHQGNGGERGCRP